MISHKKEVQFYINGELDAVSSFAGNLPFPLTNGFRLGPTDDHQATSTVGGIDDFRIYGTSLSALDVKKLYGAGNGDFNQKTIQFSYSEDLEISKTIDVYFLDDGMPVEITTSGPDRFDVGDISDVNATISNLSQVGIGHYQFALSPDDNSTSANLFVMINGSGIKTSGFGDTFNDANFSFFIILRHLLLYHLLFLIGNGGVSRVLRLIPLVPHRFLYPPFLRVWNTTQA